MIFMAFDYTMNVYHHRKPEQECKAAYLRNIWPSDNEIRIFIYIYIR